MGEPAQSDAQVVDEAQQEASDQAAGVADEAAAAEVAAPIDEDDDDLTSHKPFGARQTEEDVAPFGARHANDALAPLRPSRVAVEEPSAPSRAFGARRLDDYDDEDDVQEQRVVPEAPQLSPEELQREAHQRAALAAKAARWTPQEVIDEEGESAWALTYLDVLTLLLTLFVALMARATLDVREVKTADPQPITVQEDQAAEAVASLASELQRHEEESSREEVEELTNAGFGDSVEVLPVKGGIQIRIDDKLLFAPGKADIKREGVELIGKLAEHLVRRGNPITVEGHTDAVPIKSSRFPSNWELSAGRASAVVRALIDHAIAPTRLRAVGYGDTSPIADNESPEGRARNRRVVLMLSAAKRIRR